MKGLGRALLAGVVVAGAIGCSPRVTDPAHGANGSCASDGACGGSTSTDGGILTCSERLTDADQRAQAIVAGADTTCTTDADCVFSTGISCATTCFPSPISRAGAAEIAPALAALDSGVCESISSAGCASPDLLCTASGTLRCVGKICLSQGLDGCDSCITEIPPSCGKRVEQMTILIYEYLARADHTCSADTDCTGVRLSSDCFYDCAVGVSKSSAPALESALQGIEQSICPTYLGDGCAINTNMKGCFLMPGADGGIPAKCLSNYCQ